MAKKQIATFLGSNKGLSIVGNHCYAFSGKVTPSGGTSADTIALQFQTGKYYSKVKLNWTCQSTSATVDQWFDVILNGETVFFARAEDDETATGQSPLKLIIPPLTECIIKVGDNAQNIFTVVLAGRVYDA